MRKTAKLLYIILVAMLTLGMALLCVGCDEKEGGNVDDEDEKETVKLTISGNDISLYSIVYARSDYSSEEIAHIYTEYDFYRLTAEDIQARIYDLTGVTLPTSRDSDTKKGKYEILVGPTNRTESSVYTDALGVYEYINRVKNAKLTIGGGYNSTPLVNGLKKSYSWASTYHAFEYVARYVYKQMINGAKEIDLEEGFTQSGTVELTTVACIGDSITEGFASSNWDVCSYPAAMQRVLWKDYVVLNYGASARTMRSDLYDHYVNTDYYKAAVEHAENFDIALIMLGTNDSDRDSSFDFNDDKVYNDSALDIAFALSNKRDMLEFVIMNCPAYYGNGTSGSEHVRALQSQLPALFEENGYICHFFDMHAFTDEALTSAHFPDSLHPDDVGYHLMGVKLAEVISELVK